MMVGTPLNNDKKPMGVVGHLLKEETHEFCGKKYFQPSHHLNVTCDTISTSFV